MKIQIFYFDDIFLKYTVFQNYIYDSKIYLN
jgi:hypothetical protein